MPRIPSLPAIPVLAPADQLPIEDTSTGTTSKMTLDQLRLWLGSLTSWSDYTDVVPTRTTSDDPTYVLTFAGVDLTAMLGKGMKLSWVQNGIRRYGFINKAPAYAASNTTVSVLTRLDSSSVNYDVLDTSTNVISGFQFSQAKAPFGFPIEPLNWTYIVTDTTLRIQSSPVNNTKYNIGTVKMTVPVGDWDLIFEGSMQPAKSGSSGFDMRTSLSTSASSESDSRFTSFIALSFTASTGADIILQFLKFAPITLTTKADYYAIMWTVSNSMTAIHFRNDLQPLTIRAVCPYL